MFTRVIFSVSEAEAKPSIPSVAVSKKPPAHGATVTKTSYKVKIVIKITVLH